MSEGDMPPCRADITDALIERWAVPSHRQRIIYDSLVREFCVRIHPTGSWAYCARYKHLGRVRHYTLSAEEAAGGAQAARCLVRAIVDRAREGFDPAAEKQLAAGGATVSQLIRRYLRDGPSTKLTKRASSWATDRSNFLRHVEPTIGRMRIHHVRRSDITRMARDIMEGRTACSQPTKARGVARVRGGAGAAKRVVQATAAMFAWAMEQEIAQRNPARNIRMPSGGAPGRSLTPDEAIRLLTTLDRMEAERSLHPRFANQIRLLLFTGARKGEIIALRWEEIDRGRQRIVLSAGRTKTGNHIGARHIQLNDRALSVLDSIERSSEWVFPAGRRMEGYAKGLQKAWVEVRHRAGLEGMRIHDLRHSFASSALSQTQNVFLVSRLLGHTSVRMTERYLHARDDELHALAQRVGTGLS